MGNLIKLELVSGLSVLDISDVTNYIWEGHAGMGLANLHRLLARGPQQQGDMDFGYLLDPRTVQINGWIKSKSIDDLYTKQATLLSYANPTNTNISLRVTRIASNTVRQLDCYVVGGLDFAQTPWDGYNYPYQITLRANDPTWYDTTPVQAGFFGPGVGTAVPIPVPIALATTNNINQTQPINYYGSADAYPWIVIYGPINSPVLTFADGVTSYKLDFTGVNIAGGDYRSIDCRYPYKTVTDSAGANKNGDLTVDSNLATLKINKPLTSETYHSVAVTLTGSATTGATLVNIVFYTRYIGI